MTNYRKREIGDFRVMLGGGYPVLIGGWPELSDWSLKTCLVRGKNGILRFALNDTKMKDTLEVWRTHLSGVSEWLPSHPCRRGFE
jgi:hypothetical protein